MDNKNFARRIAEIRKAKGLSQKELGDMLGVSNKAVSKWENGESLPKTSTMLKISELLEIDVSELIGAEGKDYAELNALKSENSALKMSLEKINQKRRKNIIFICAVCAVCIVAAVIIVFLTDSHFASDNNISCAGEQGTKIVFNDREFLPADGFAEYVIEAQSSFGGVEKYAQFYEPNGNSRSVLIGCNELYQSVSLTSNGKTYYYIANDEDFNFGLNDETISNISIRAGSASSGQGSLNTVATYAGYYDGSFVKKFCDFINSSPEKADPKTVELYFGAGDSKTLVIYLSDNAIDLTGAFFVDMGEFFHDDEDNVYFYDYSTGSAYIVGEELSVYVYNLG